MAGAVICGGRSGTACRQHCDFQSLPPLSVSPFSGLPPAYTFVGDGEPFYAETVRYIENLKKCGIPASVDVYHSDMHAFDMMQPDTPLSREATRRFNEQFAYAQTHYFAPQGESER